MKMAPPERAAMLRGMSRKEFNEMMRLLSDEHKAEIEAAGDLKGITPAGLVSLYQKWSRERSSVLAVPRLHKQLVEGPKTDETLKLAQKLANLAKQDPLPKELWDLAPECQDIRDGQRRGGRRTASGQTILTWAATQGELPLVKFLIQHARVEMDQKDSQGKTALIKSAEVGHLDVVRWLLEQGANSDIEESRGLNALQCAALCRRLAVVELMVGDFRVRVSHNDDMELHIARQDPTLF